MQLNVTTDYAIRTVLYLGQCKKIASATEISNEMGIPRGYLEKVLSKLKRQNIFPQIWEPEADIDLIRL